MSEYPDSDVSIGGSRGGGQTRVPDSLHILLMENKHRKFFVISALKKCKFMPKMHQNTFGGRALSGPAGWT